MKSHAWAIAIIFAVLIGTGPSVSKEQTKPKSATVPQKGSGSTREFEKSYAMLRPEQKRLVDDVVALYRHGRY
jgi:hypothetical protein